MGKRKLGVACIMVCCIGMTSCSQGSNEDILTEEAGSGKVLNVYCWNNEFKNRVESYYPDYDESTHKIGDIRINWVIIPNENNAYQRALDEALLERDTDAENDRVDLFLVEADNAVKYTGEAGLAMKLSDLGITEEDLSEQFDYTKEVVTGQDNALRGISWQACPGVMFYRRDIAKEVLGTDDPEQIQKLVEDWESFDELAKRLKENQVQMIAGYDDTYRVFSSNMTEPWVRNENQVVIDSSLWEWVNQGKLYSENGYNGTDRLWSRSWGEGARGNVFCYFGPAWFMDYALEGWTLETALDAGGEKKIGNGTYGEWAACKGPQGYFWGGSWICAAEGTDNEDIIADLMKKLCCDKNTALSLAKDVNEFANHKGAMKELAIDENFGTDFLGGQNLYKVMYDSAGEVHMDHLTAYDQGLNESFQDQFHEYFNGNNNIEEALDNFIQSAMQKYPNLELGEVDIESPLEIEAEGEAEP